MHHNFERAVKGFISMLFIFSCITINKTVKAKDYRGGMIAFFIGFCISILIIQNLSTDNSIVDSLIVACVWSFLGYCVIYPITSIFTRRRRKSGLLGKLLTRESQAPHHKTPLIVDEEKLRIEKNFPALNVKKRFFIKAVVFKKILFTCLIIASLIDSLLIILEIGDIIRLNEKIRITEVQYKAAANGNQRNKNVLLHLHESKLNLYIDELSESWIHALIMAIVLVIVGYSLRVIL